MRGRRGARGRAAHLSMGVGLVTAVCAMAPAGAGAAVAHVVQPGESLWSIAAANNLTTRTVAAYNGLAEDAMVVVGQTIDVPTVDEGAAALASAGVSTETASTPSSTGASHLVVAGESLSSVAAANGITIDALAAANGLASDAFLIEGQTIQVPAAGTTSTAAGTGVPAPAPGSTYGLGHIPSPSGELHLDPAAADSWNAMRETSLRDYGVDLYPDGPLSAYRTYEQQAYMYDEYLAGRGPLAAPPGTSAHEFGAAVDLAEPVMRDVIDQIGGAFGWAKTEAPGEWWHVNYTGGG